MIEATVAFLFGLLIGSFLNVCVYRWPRELSVVAPRSYCPGCKAPIAWYDNVPVLSYAVLRGRCRHCQTGISVRYPALELATALMFAGIALRYGFSLATVKWCVFDAILLALMVSDLEQRFLPLQLTVGGAAVGVVFAWLVPNENPFPFLAGADARTQSVADAAAGAIVPALAIWLVGELYFRVRKREGLGLGDVLMLGAIGAFLGLSGGVFALLVGSVIGSVAGVFFILARGKDSSTYELPLGTFLGLGALVSQWFGDAVLGWYTGRITGVLSGTAVFPLVGWFFVS